MHTSPISRLQQVEILVWWCFRNKSRSKSYSRLKFSAKNTSRSPLFDFFALNTYSRQQPQQICVFSFLTLRADFAARFSGYFLVEGPKAMNGGTVCSLSRETRDAYLASDTIARVFFHNLPHQTSLIGRHLFRGYFPILKEPLSPPTRLIFTACFGTFSKAGGRGLFLIRSVNQKRANSPLSLGRCTIGSHCRFLFLSGPTISGVSLASPF